MLVADDDAPIRRVLVRALARFGMTVTQVEDGEAAVAEVVADPTRYRIVLLDLTMPRLNGDEALLRIREVAPQLPALMLSGFLEEEIRDRVAGAPRVGLLQKPFSMRVLADVLWQMLGPQAG